MPARPDRLPTTQAETRAYRVPDFIIAEEQELLASHKAASLSDLLSQIHADLLLTAFLLRNFTPEKDLGGEALRLVGQELCRPLEHLARLCSLLDDFVPVRVTEKDHYSVPCAEPQRRENIPQ